MDEVRDALARLDVRLQNLECRISALEHRPHPVTPLPVPAAIPARGVPAAEEFALPQAGRIFPVVGKAMLGIAGAYLLRAVAESGSLPKLAVVALALAYTATWLVWAARVPAGARFASTTYAATAALILAPMLGELTLRFRVLPAAITAGLLGAFVIASSALAWKRNLAPVVWVAGVAGVFTAFTLLIASRDLVPYIAALLLMALVSEFAAARNRWLPLRALVAPAVDIAVWILVYVCSLPESSRSEYAAVSTPASLVLPSLLFLIYGASIAFRTTFLRQRITIFEIAQAVISFLLSGLAWLRFASGTGLLGFGIFCWMFSAACYAAAFVRFDRIAEQRNYHVYATWSAALVLAGSFLVLPPPLAAVFEHGGDRGHTGGRTSSAPDARVSWPGIPGCGRIYIRIVGICRPISRRELPQRAWPDSLGGGGFRACLLRHWRTIRRGTLEPETASAAVSNPGSQCCHCVSGFWIGLAGGDRHESWRIACRRHPHPHHLRLCARPGLRRRPLAAHRAGVDRLRRVGLCHGQTVVRGLTPWPLGIDCHFDFHLCRGFDCRTSGGAL